MPNGDVTPDSLIRAIESVQEAIRRDGRTIWANETRTRNTLIDPLLRALGWDDPSVVTQEYLVRYGAREFEYGVADYAFHPPGQRANPMAFLEAKRMNEDLADEHRNQVFTYALDKGGSVRQFGLTNGDRWELYGLNEGEPFKIFEFSIKKQSASDCADLLLSHFPMLNKPRNEGNLQRVEVLMPAMRRSSALSHAPSTHYSTSNRSAGRVDVYKILTWFGVSFAIWIILGWIGGVLEAEPVKGFFATLGLFVSVFLLIALAFLLWRISPSTLKSILSFLQLKRLFAPTRGDRLKTWTLVVVAIVGGFFAGGFLGNFIGSLSAKSVVSALEILGQLTTIVLITVLLISFGAGTARRSNKRRREGWRPRSSYRKRHW